MAYTPDGRTLAVQLGSNTVQLRNAATGAVRFSLGSGREPGGAARSSLAVSPDGTHIAIAVDSDTGASSAVDLISPATGKETATIPVASPVVYSLAFSPDGKTLAIGAGKNLLLLNLSTRTSISVSTDQHSFTGDSMYVSFSADGKYLAVASNAGIVKIWDMRQSKFTTSIPAYGPASLIQAAAISPDGGTVAVSGSAANDDNGTSVDVPETWLWNPSTGHVRPLPLPASLDSASDNIDTQAFSPDGGMIVTGDDNGIIRFWDTATGLPVTTDFAPSKISPITAAAFAPDGRSLVTAQSITTAQGGTATVQLWGLYSATEPSSEHGTTGGSGSVWRSAPPRPPLPALRPGVYRVGQVIVTSGSWVITLDSVQVAKNGRATFIITSKNTSTVAGQLSCTASPDPLAASIALATEQVINSEEAYCPSYPDSENIAVPAGGSIKSYAVFANSRGLGQPFTFDWDGPSDLSGARSYVTLSR